MASVRHAAVQVIHGLDNERGSLATLLPQWSVKIDEGDRALLQEMCFGVARWSIRLSAILEQLMKKPLRNKDRDIHALLQVGLYQLEYMRIPDHAVLNNTVAVAKELGKPWAKALVNGLLRNWLRQRDEINDKLDSVSDLSFQNWMVEELRKDWPEQWQVLLKNSNTKAPMTLRVNRRRSSMNQYRQLLDEKNIDSVVNDGLSDALTLVNPRSADSLPGLRDGIVSVQDVSAQRASLLLNPVAGEHVLDACAAPGGKTCHMLELADALTLTAIDVSKQRLARVDENIRRLGFASDGEHADPRLSNVRVVCADVAASDDWWDGELFDAIMLDAPCSGSGVIRRHPDIKLLRRASDLGALVENQRLMLDVLWKTLKPGGRLLYATCSVFRSENDTQMDRFFSKTPDASEIELPALTSAVRCQHGLQILTEESGADGFYYCLVKKNALH